MTEHMPGPWFVEAPEHELIKMNFLPITPTLIIWCQTDHPDAETRENAYQTIAHVHIDEPANARLIAASPDLLAALENLFALSCISYCDYEHEKVEAANQARAAIAKAHGG